MKRFWFMLFLGLIILISFISNTFNTSFIKTSIGFSNICSYSIATYRTLGFEDFVQIGDLKIYNFQIGDFRHIEYAEGCLAEIVEFGKNKFNDICYFKNLPQVAFEEVDGIRFIYLYDVQKNYRPSSVLRIRSSCADLNTSTKYAEKPAIRTTRSR